MQNYGEALKYQREIANLTQPELAKQIGTSQANISRWEHGEVIPNIDFCVKLAKFYEVSLNELLGLEDNFGVKETEKSLRAYDHHEITDKQTVDLVKLYKALSDYNKAVVFGYVVRLIEESGLNVNSVLRN